MEEPQRDSLFQVIVSEKEIIIKPSSDSVGLKDSLRIQRNPFQIEQAASFKEPKIKTTLYYDAFLGFIQVIDGEFLVFVEEAENICLLNDSEIYEIKKISCIPLDPQQVISKEMKSYLQGIQGIFENCHYFSYTYPLSSRYERISQNYTEEKQFWWNYDMLKKIQLDKVKSQKDQISTQWNVQMIQGHVGYFETTHSGNRLQYYLITRRSSMRGGVRFTQRGADLDGNVANYGESEQIVTYKGKIYSHIQIRGSVPLLWEQKGVRGQVLRLSGASDMSSLAFKKHFEKLQNQYPDYQVYIVNLMKESNTKEHPLTLAYQKEIENQKGQFNLEYQHFDFNTHKSQVNATASKYRSGTIEDYKYFKFDLQNKVLNSQQKGIFRTNCKDCLDRTNNYMMKIGLAALESIFLDCNINLEEMAGGNPLEKMDSGSCHIILKNFKYAWAKTGDNISCLYAGTDATTSNLTKNGYGGMSNKISHRFKSMNVGINRWVKASYQDGFKQECLDLICGKHIQSNLQSSNLKFFKETLAFSKKKYSVFTVALNVMECEITEKTGFPEFFQIDKANPLPAIIVVGLQEVISFSKLKMFKHHDKEKVQLWKKCIIANLNNNAKSKDKYLLVDEHDMLGNLLFVFALAEVSEHIGDIYHDSIKHGFMNQAAESGCVATHLKFGVTTLCFVNLNLPSGRKKWDKRISALENIHQSLFQKQGVGKYKKLSLQEHDIVFLIGDFNFRVERDFKDTKKLIDSANPSNIASIIETLFTYDELFVHKNKNQKANHCLIPYKEPEIEFLPTFNDSSKKQRCASWRHRLLYSQPTQKLILHEKTIKYGAIDNEYYQKFTDHKPVYAFIECDFEIYDEALQEEKLELFIQQNYSQEEQEEMKKDIELRKSKLQSYISAQSAQEEEQKQQEEQGFDDEDEDEEEYGGYTGKMAYLL